MKLRDIGTGAKVAAAIVLVCVLIFGIWWFGWKVRAANVDEQYQVDINSQRYQSGLISQERDIADGWNRAVDPAQKDLLKVRFCTTYLTLTHPPADLVAANTTICE